MEQKPIEIHTPLSENIVEMLRRGDRVLLSGSIYTARDEAHRKLVECIRQNKPLPFDLNGQVIYYAGPTPAPPGHVIGSVGPTSSYRMDMYTISLLQKGLKGMIGKGRRSRAILEGLKKYKAVYFSATGGAAALLSKHVKKAELIAFQELGPEAIYCLEVENFPIIVINDCVGGDLYQETLTMLRSGKV